jgi:hypothetical protein
MFGYTRPPVLVEDLLNQHANMLHRAKIDASHDEVLVESRSRVDVRYKFLK